MNNPESTSPYLAITDLVRDHYDILDIALREIYEQKQTFEDDTLLDTATTVLYNTIHSVVAAHTQYCHDDVTPKIAFEAFWLAVQIASVLPQKLLFNPGGYYGAAPDELYTKMAKDAQEYLAEKPYISTLIDENIDAIDPSETHHVMIESFVAVAIMQFEQAQQDQPVEAVDDIDIELARIVFSVDPTIATEE